MAYGEYLAWAIRQITPQGITIGLMTGTILAWIARGDWEKALREDDEQARLKIERRKCYRAHACSRCGQTIPARTPLMRFTLFKDGRTEVRHACLECAKHDLT